MISIMVVLTLALLVVIGLVVLNFQSNSRYQPRPQRIRVETQEEMRRLGTKNRRP